jgi:hypothetical protein
MNPSEYDSPAGNDTLENRLVYWLSTNRWSIDEASKIICNIMPDKCSAEANGDFSSVTLFNGERIPTLDYDGFPLGEYIEFENGSGVWDFKHDLLELSRRFNDIKRLLARAFGLEEYIKPMQVIDFIKSKNITIPWLEHALINNLISPGIKKSLNKKEMWVEKARDQGTIYMNAWRGAGFEPTIANIGLYVEGLFSNEGTYNTNGNVIDKATIIREALTGITGNKKGKKSTKKIPSEKIEKLPE